MNWLSICDHYDNLPQNGSIPFNDGELEPKKDKNKSLLIEDKAIYCYVVRNGYFYQDEKVCDIAYGTGSQVLPDGRVFLAPNDTLINKLSVHNIIKMEVLPLYDKLCFFTTIKSDFSTGAVFYKAISVPDVEFEYARICRADGFTNGTKNGVIIDVETLYAIVETINNDYDNSDNRKNTWHIV